MEEQLNNRPTRAFSWPQIVGYAAAFGAIVIVLQRSLRYVCQNVIEFDCAYYWPVSIFRLRFPTVVEVLIAASVLIGFYLITRFLESRRYPLPLVCALSIALIVGLTLIHGIEIGLYTPIAGDARSGELIPYSVDGQEYYHDAIRVADPIAFFSRYNEIQPTLHMHGHTHPPGAILTFYLFAKIFRDPAFIALAILLIAAPVTAYFFYRMVRTEVSDETSRYSAFLLLLLPVVQIYYLATIDALVAAILTATLYFFCFGEGRRANVAAIVLLTLSFFLTFVSLFILPVLCGFDLIVRRSLKRTTIVFGGLFAVYAVIYLVTGYNAFHSFRTASQYENPQGFMLFVNPVNYLFTRFEDIAEIVFFLGPFLTVLLYRGVKMWPEYCVKKFRPKPLDVLTLLGCVTLLGMYFAGAWRTGETARAGAFIYPYLLFPVCRYIERSRIAADGRMQLAALVFLQSLGLQLIGNFHW